MEDSCMCVRTHPHQPPNMHAHAHMYTHTERNKPEADFPLHTSVFQLYGTNCQGLS